MESYFSVVPDPCKNLYIAELGWWKFGGSPSTSPVHFKLHQMPAIGHDPVARVTVCDLDGNVQARFGGSNPILPGNFVAPHGIWADSRGDIYVGEVVKASGGIERFAPLTPQSFQKFVRAR